MWFGWVKFNFLAYAKFVAKLASRIPKSRSGETLQDFGHQNPGPFTHLLPPDPERGASPWELGEKYIDLGAKTLKPHRQSHLASLL